MFGRFFPLRWFARRYFPRGTDAIPRGARTARVGTEPYRTATVGCSPSREATIGSQVHRTARTGTEP